MAKQVLLFLATAVMLSCLGLSAQDTLPLHPEVGSEWYYDLAYLSVPYGYDYGYSKVTIVKDTIVEEVSCLKTVTEFYNERGILCNREEGLVLYEGAKAYDLYDGKKLLKYDLEAQEGDVVPIGFNYLKVPASDHGVLDTKAVVEKRELVHVNGHELIRQHYKIEVRYATDSGEVVDTLRRSYTQLLGCAERDDLQSIPHWYDATGDDKLFNSNQEKLRCFRSPSLDYKAKSTFDCDYVSKPVAIEDQPGTTAKLWVEGDKLLWSAVAPRIVSIYDMSATLIRSISVAEGMSSTCLDFLSKGESYLIVLEDRLGDLYTVTIVMP